ncbi:zona pellucida sperm-binding protein 1-like [Ranitomeya imitator]|uniref:zona pellucida sperm-binding protein 1-like n=1 Tax=Ranitomeya imitator TaxID=111125 RepID=UPI0037E8193D
MGYDLHGCLSKCVLSTRSPKGESIFYISYTICQAVRKEGEWLLLIRLVGQAKSEDLDLICPKPKLKRPRGMNHTQRPRTTKMSKLTTTGHLWKTTPYRTSKSPTVTRLPLQTTTIKTAKIITDRTHEDTVVTWPTEDFRTTVVGATKDVVSRSAQQTEELSQKVTSSKHTDWVPITESPDTWTSSECMIPKGRITCLNATVSRDVCLGYSCCYDPVDSINPCYYGHTINIHCFPDGVFQLILSRFVTNPPLRLSSVVLGPGTCPSPKMLGDFLEFKGHLSSCSTLRFLERPVFELFLTAKQDVLVSPLGSITRDSSLTVVSQCMYNNTLSNISLVVLTPQLPMVTSTGVLRVELRISKGSSFSTFYASEDFPIQIQLRELVFLEARLLQPSDPRLHLRLHHCWGAPSTDPTTTLRWLVIYDGCPFLEDDPVTKILPGSIPSSYQRFEVSAFTFVGIPYNPQVYFFCSVSVCVPSSSESCTSDCANLTRSRRAQSDTTLYVVGTTGPLVLHREQELGVTSLQNLTSTFPGVVIAVTFLLLVLLLLVLLKLKVILHSRCI